MNENEVILIETIKEWKEVPDKNFNLEIIKIDEGRVIIRELKEIGGPRTFSIKLGPVGRKMHNYEGDILSPEYVSFLLKTYDQLIETIFIFFWSFSPVFNFAK